MSGITRKDTNFIQNLRDIKPLKKTPSKGRRYL